LDISSEEAVSTQIRDTLDKWEWYSRAIELSKQEIGRHWKRSEEEKRLRRVPHRWLPDWDLEMIQSQEQEDGWTLETWIYRNGQWGRYCLSFEHDATVEDVQGTIYRYVGIQLDMAYGPVLQFTEPRYERCWERYSLKSLREYLSLVVLPMEIYTDVDGWMSDRPNPYHPVSRLFQQKWEQFEQAKQRDLKQFEDNPLKRIRFLKKRSFGIRDDPTITGRPCV
jgi:hypothetical protein